MLYPPWVLATLLAFLPPHFLLLSSFPAADAALPNTQISPALAPLELSSATRAHSTVPLSRRASSTKSSSSSSSRNIECNGYQELCDRPYNRVSFPATHNSYAYATNNIAANQEKSIRQQLDGGIRVFMLDIHRKDRNTIPASVNIRRKRDDSSDPSGISLCHTLCLLLYDGPLADELLNFRQYLDANPHEVLTIFFENNDSFTPEQIAADFSSVGLDKYVYAPSKTSNGTITWPTLRDMIDQNKRLFVFSDRSINIAAVPWILPQNQYVAQTSYEVQEGSTFPCSPDSITKPLVILNHFAYKTMTVLGRNLPVPIYQDVDSINSGQSFNDQLALCNTTLRSPQMPNFVTVDFYNHGDVFKAVAEINGLPYKSFTTNTFRTSDDSSHTPPVSLPSLVVSIAVPLLVALAMTLGT
ncbi:hypothetical protein EV182_000002 [Spiromyces aspiralis]|uniref:Uncharacterized protein n=1 Tax=Spiromyces aspiralis TaxID=68401 RepID=A0ACC1HVE1_9FUNG|nr:hypothetical protein EV182_000002 [Spiromyces aspiralis]